MAFFGLVRTFAAEFKIILIMTNKEILSIITSAREQMKESSRLLDEMSDTISERLFNNPKSYYTIGRLKGASLCDIDVKIGMMQQRITFYFLNEDKLATLKETDFTQEELENGVLDVVRDYFALQAEGRAVYALLPERMRKRMVLQVVLDLKLEDAIRLYQGQYIALYMQSPRNMILQFSPTEAMDIDLGETDMR